MQFLRLEPAKYAFNRLALAAVRGGRAVDMAYQVKESYLFRILLLFQPLVSALVVVHNLERLVPAHLDRHAVGVILRLEILVVADIVAQKDLAVCVDYLVHHRGAYLSFLVPVIQVQLRSVTVPEGVAPVG